MWCWVEPGAAQLPSKGPVTDLHTQLSKQISEGVTRKERIWIFLIFSKAGSCYVVQMCFDLMLFLPQPPQRWNPKCAPQCP